jgi:hypothetical protein
MTRCLRTAQEKFVLDKTLVLIEGHPLHLETRRTAYAVWRLDQWGFCSVEDEVIDMEYT